MAKIDSTNITDEDCDVNTSDEEKIQNFININQLEESEFSPIMSEIKWCRENLPKPKPKIRDKWYQNYSMGEKFEQDFDINFEKVTQVNIPVTHTPPPTKYAIGDTVSAIDAIKAKGSIQGFDIRPKIFDNLTKSWVLLDSGSCVSCHPPGPNDKIDPSLKLKAVNGAQIDTYGTKQMSLRINRKTYSIQAVVAAVPAPIFGWDIFQKYKLTLDWNDAGESILVDKKAQISTVLKHETVEKDSVPRIEEMSNNNTSHEAQLFEIQCMKRLDKFISAIQFNEDSEEPFMETTLPLKSDPDYGEEERENLEALKSVAEPYAQIIKKYPGILKTTFKNDPVHNIFHTIDTTGGKPVKSKVRPLLADSEKSIQGKQTWEEMERLGVIERVNPSELTEWSSSLHLVKKPSGKGWRVCVDFRPLNNQTKSESYPLPKLKSFTHQLKGAKLFSKIDLRSAFWNLAIHPNSVNKTCTLSPWGGAFVFKRLPFGLKNGPQAWMKFLNHVLSGIPGIFAYLDDLLLFSKTQEEHQTILEQVFKRLEENGLTLALDKCVFAQESVEYLGFEVTSSGLSPIKRKVDAVYNIPPPQTQKELLSFLGALNYFRLSLGGLVKNGKYKNAANLLQPLYSAATTKLPSKQKFKEVWENAPLLHEAFLDAKKLLINATKLGYQDPNLPLELYCDASDHSVGAVLMQVQSGKRVPLGYFSRHLPIEKTHWAVYRKELEAARSGIRYFIEEIYGRHCTIFSDHLPLVKAWEGQGFQLHDPVAQRALLEISQFTKDIKHISGNDNCGSDYFSRLPPPEKRGTVYTKNSIPVAALEGHKLEAVSPAVVNELQAECEEIREIKEGKCPPSAKFEDVKFGDYMLFCEVSGARPRPYLPQKLRLFVQKQLHFDHKGQKEAVNRLSSHYYWKDIRADTITFIKTCHGCQSTNASKTKPPHIGQFEEPDHRFTHCHLDIVGPLPPSKGYKYILTIKDRSTRLVQGIPLVTPTSEAIAEAFMLHWTSMFGIPSVCTSDRGSNLTSEMFKGLQDQLGIHVTHSPIYYPQTNGLIERSHQTLKNTIKATLIEMGDKYQKNWIYYLPWALLGIRSSFNKDLNTSPLEMTLGKHVQLPGTILADPQDIMKNEDINVDSLLKRLQMKDNRMAVPPSLNKPNPTVPTLPDFVSHVYVRQHNVKGLSPKYLGPFPVTSRPSRSTIEIKVGVNKQGLERREIRHISDTKVAYLREDATIATRPKRGRPSKNTSETVNTTSSNVIVNKPATNNKMSPNLDNDPPFHGFGTQSSIDYADPNKAGNLNDRAWSASPKEIQEINYQISRSNA